MATLKINDVAISLGGKPVIDDISMSVSQGEFVSILGPSGAGKSTLFRLLTGELNAKRGTITYDNAPLSRTANTFAFMPQHDALMPWRRVLDNIILGLEVQGSSRAEAQGQVLPLLADFGLDGFEQHYPSQLSGGMRQRAALLRTLVQARPIQLLDEPFGALDALTRMQMQRWLETRWLTSRWTTLLVTHDVREAVALSDRIYVFSRRPARIIAEVEVKHPRPRFDRPSPASAHQLEAQLLETLLTQTGDEK